MGLKDALRAAIHALQRKWGNSTAIAEQEQDKNTLKQRWQNNVQKVPNASQAVIAYCACLLSSQYISFLPCPPPVCPLSFTLHIQNQLKVSMLSPLYNLISLSRSLSLPLSRSLDSLSHCLARSLSRCLALLLLLIFQNRQSLLDILVPLLCEIEPYRFQFRLYIES